MRTLHWLIFAAVALTVTGCDHATKLLATSVLSGGHVETLITGVLSLEQAHNTDTAFGILAGILPLEQRLLLLRTVATLGSLVVAILAVTRFARASMLERLAWALLLGGAVGNAIDRWRWGYVVDFIRLEHWPTFNVADAALCVGVALLLLAGRLTLEPKRLIVP
jgi:signal peptidase II